MAHSANVQSIDDLEALRAALVTFGDEAGGALAELEQQINRFLEWLAHDRVQYWRAQIRRASEAVGEARTNYDRKRIMTVGGERPACREEKELLMRAQRRHRLCEEKLEAVRRWIRACEQEVIESQGRINQLADHLAGDLPGAVATLDRMLAALADYAGRSQLSSTSRSRTQLNEGEAAGDGEKSSSGSGADADARV